MVSDGVHSGQQILHHVPTVQLRQKRERAGERHGAQAWSACPSESLARSLAKQRYQSACQATTRHSAFQLAGSLTATVTKDQMHDVVCFPFCVSDM